MREEAQAAQAVIELNDYDLTVGCHVFAYENRLISLELKCIAAFPL